MYVGVVWCDCMVRCAVWRGVALRRRLLGLGLELGLELGLRSQHTFSGLGLALGLVLGLELGSGSERTFSTEEAGIVSLFVQVGARVGVPLLVGRQTRRRPTLRPTRHRRQRLPA